MQRLETLWLPDEVDLSWSISQGQMPVNLVIKTVWIPRYISNQDPIYEEPEDEAKCDRIELVPLSKGYTIHLVRDPENPNTIEYGRSHQHIQRAAWNFQRLLTALTGLNFLTSFSMTALRGLRKDLPADVLCFRKQGDKNSRMAFRWKGRHEVTTSWTTATLTSVLQVVNRKQVLEVELINREDGHSLVLAGVTAKGARANQHNEKSQKMTFRVQQGSVYPFELNTCEYTLSTFSRTRVFLAC